MSTTPDLREAKRTYDMARGQYRLAIALLEHVSLRPGARILDVGAGRGEFASYLSSQGFQVVCTESIQRFVDDLKQKGFESYAVDCEEEQLPFADESFDLVVSLEVIEHIWNTDNYLSEIRRVLKTDGFFVCTTPNYNHWRYRFYSALGRFERFTFKSRHKKFYTAKSFPKELSSFFVVSEILGFGWLPKVRVQFFVKRWFSNVFAVHSGILCKKQ